MGVELTMACTSDFSGLVRGKGFRSTDLDRKVARGIGWTPTNVQITCFDTIADSPYGALGDLVLRPDPETLVNAALPGGGRLHFLLGDITELDGSPWECCTRSLLKAALARFRAVSGLELRATFEHEFMLPGGRGTRAFTLAGFLERQRFGEALFDALEGAGIAPDSFLREYGPDQMEITLPPAPALRAADEAVIVREVTRATAAAMGLTATFSPLCAPDIVGNGVHIHMSLWDGDRPVTHDPQGKDGLSAPASAFVAGVLAHLNAVSALTAPSAISCLRLVPHRWSAAYNNLGAQDREAGIRICPVTATDPDTRARQFNVEFRAADAAASPHLALAAVVAAGTLGMEAGLRAAPATTEDLSLLSPEDLDRRGLRRLPPSLGAALDDFLADAPFLATLPPRMPAIYAAHKKGELAHVEPMTEAERFAAYAATY
jgi:glutamine synthetase